MNAQRHGRDGRTIVYRTFTGTCQRCQEEFSRPMTTHTFKYCDTCAPIAHREKKRSREKSRARVVRKTIKSMPRLVRYAGFDPSERPLMENEDGK